VLEVVRAYEQASGRPVPYAFSPRRPGDIDACYADASLARERLHWQALRSLQRMCEDSWRWQSNNPDGFKA
jgi:UDP-glucose 4-epimerase